MLPFNLEAHGRLSEEDRSLLERFAGRDVRELNARRDLVREGEKPRGVILVLEGWAACYKQLKDGRRQTTSFLLPGDFADLNTVLARELDHGIAAITNLRYAEIGAAEFERLLADGDGLALAFWRHQLAVASTNREWVVNVGQRTALERIAHLICELYFKLRAAGRAEGGRCDWPLTQSDLAEATGLTSVHVNRTLQQMRRDGLIELAGRKLTISDLVELQSVGGFNPNYLHLDGEGADGLSDR